MTSQRLIRNWNLAFQMAERWFWNLCQWTMALKWLMANYIYNLKQLTEKFSKADMDNEEGSPWIISSQRKCFRIWRVLEHLTHHKIVKRLLIELMIWTACFHYHPTTGFFLLSYWSLIDIWESFAGQKVLWMLFISGYFYLPLSPQDLP